MGYELVFHFQEVDKNLPPEEQVTEHKTKVVKIGNPNEEIGLEVVAGKIMAQLARRTILVTNVEIFEYTKKSLSYKETDDGILIKGRKFSFDGGDVMLHSSGEEQSDVPCQPQQTATASSPQSSDDLLKALLANPQILALLNPKPAATPIIGAKAPVPGAVLANTSKGGALVLENRQEIFNPENAYLLRDAKNKNLAFTLGRKYLILSEQPAGTSHLSGMLYTVVDDNGKKQLLSDKYFTTSVNLQGREYNEPFRPAALTPQSDGLSSDGYADEEDQFPKSIR